MWRARGAQAVFDFSKPVGEREPEHPMKRCRFQMAAAAWRSSPAFPPDLVAARAQAAWQAVAEPENASASFAD
eukprot:3528580-Alexandrium_andersonii.AAC.1